MNQTIQVTRYSPLHEGLGEEDLIVVGLNFNMESGLVSIELTDKTFAVTLEDLTKEGRHDSVSNQIIASLKNDDMSDEEKVALGAIRRKIDSIVYNRALESRGLPRGERGL